MAKLTKAEQKTLLDSTIYQNDNEEIKGANHNGMLTDFIDSGMNETEPTIQENLNANNKKIVNLTDPTNDQDASTKKYVDDKQLDNGSGTTVDGNAIDWHGPLTRAATQIDIAPGQTLEFLGTDSTDFVKQLFQDSSIELISIADDVDAANNIGQFAKTGIAEVLSKPGILLRTVTKDLAVGATVILNQDGIISVGAPAISPSTAFSHFKFLHDYSAKWDALSAGEKDLIITSFGYQKTNFLSKLDTANQEVASNVTFAKNAGVSGKLIAFTTSPTFDVDNSNIQEMPVTSAVTSIDISGAAAGGNYRILLKNGASGPYTYPSLGTSFGTATTNSESLDGSSKVMNIIDVQVTVSTPIVVVHSIETVTLP